MPRVRRNVGRLQINGLLAHGYKKAGPKYGPNTYVKPTGRKAGKKPPAPPAPLAPPGPPPTPYDRYRETAPWAIPGLLQIDRDQAAHQSYVTDKVAPWLSQSLMGLQGFQDTAQSSYSNAIQGAAGGAMNVSSAMTPLGYGGGAMGGIVAGNNQYLTEGGSIRAAGGASALVQEALNRERMNKLSPIPYSQGAIQAVADYAKNLPTQYTERRRQFTEGVEKFIAEQQQAAAELAEEVRSNKVNEAIRATNAETNAAIQFGRLGLSAEELAADSAQPSGPVPAGYVQLPDGRYVRDPTVPAASNAQPRQPSTRGQYTKNQLRKEGFVPLSPKAGAKWKQRATRATDGSLWIKKGSGSGGGDSSSGARLTVTELEKDLLDIYKPGEDGGWEARYEGDPQGAGVAVARWVRENKPSFIKSGRRVDFGKLEQVLSAIGGRPAIVALDILKRGYIDPATGNWK